jgi:dipeptidyl-peptidase 4
VHTDGRDYGSATVRAMNTRSLALFLTVAACGAAPATPPASPPAAPPRNEPLVAAPAPAPPVVDRDFIRAYSQSRGFRRGTPQEARLAPDGKTVLFLRSKARDPEQSLFETDVASGQTREILTPEALETGPEHLTLEERARRERMRITAHGFTSFLLSQDGKTVAVTLSGKLYAFDRASGKTHPIHIGKAAAITPKLSPDGKWLAYVQNDDLYVVTVDGKSKPLALTRGGTETKAHGLADFCASEELDRYDGFFWAPDSKSILYEEADTAMLERLAIVDPGHPENGADIIPYPRAGHSNAVLRFGLVKLASPGATTWVDWDREAWPYVANVNWSEQAPPTLVVLDRLQRNESVLLVDTANGKTREAIRETDEAWVNVDPSVAAWLPDGSGFVWMSERDGDRRYGLVSRASGAGHSSADVKWLTPRGMQAEAVADLDAVRRSLVFVATRDALEREVMRVSLDGGEPVAIAHVERGAAYASFTEKWHDSFLSSERSLTGPRHLVVRSGDGKVLREIPSVADAPPTPNVELTTAGPDGMHVAIVRPRAYVQGARYAVIDSAYAGPHVQVVALDSRNWLLEQWMADATGAIVVAVDAKGTPGRGRAWERAIQGKLGDVPLEGHIAAIQSLAASHPEMDGSRVGVYGWSYGGYYSSFAALRRPDFYSAAVAIAPVADWRDYDTAYTERFLGLPGQNTAAYDEASLLTYASKPKGAREATFLLAHGTADDNVYFMNSLKLADALAKSGRSFRFLPYLGQTHQMASPEALESVWTQAADTLRSALAK